MVILTTKLDERGRITIPKEIRKKLKVKQNDVLYIQDKKNYFVIYPPKSIKIKSSLK